MAGMGPAPKPAELRHKKRAAKSTALRLPAEGRLGPAPKWPLGRASKAEGELWRDLWSLPQAVAWEQLRYTREVAQYVRWKICAEQLEGTVALKAGGEARQLADRLGLYPLALRRLEWEVASDEVAEKRADAVGSRARLKAVGAGAVAGG